MNNNQSDSCALKSGAGNMILASLDIKIYNNLSGYCSSIRLGINLTPLHLQIYYFFLALENLASCKHLFPFLRSYLHAFFPADPEISPGEETSNTVPCQMMDPPLLPQLGHNSIYPRKARSSFCPLGQCLWVSVPGYLDTNGVAIHLVKAGVVGGSCIEELSPQQLAV